MTLDKVQKLVARAAHPSTPLEEARSCAVIACKMIAAGHAELHAPANAPPESRDPEWEAFFQVLFGPNYKARLAKFYADLAREKRRRQEQKDWRYQGPVTPRSEPRECPRKKRR